MNELFRYDVINYLIEKFYNTKECRYLEIGVRDPSDCFDKINSKQKTSVDPCIETQSKIDYKVTSDEFFRLMSKSNTTRMWDIVLIDGLHLADQVYRDIYNSIKHLADGGFIVLHDCNPPHWSWAHSDHDDFIKNQRSWNGTVWKAFYKFRHDELYGFETYTIETDLGLGIIHKNGLENKLPRRVENPFFEYGIFSKTRKDSLGLISVEEFYEKYDSA
jgi:hypothetical protein